MEEQKEEPKPLDLLNDYIDTAYADKLPTQKQYKNHFKRLSKLNIDIDNDDNCIDNINNLELTMSQKLGILNLIVIYRSKVKYETMDKDFHPLFILRTDIRKEETTKKIAKNEFLKSQLPSRTVLHRYMEEQYNKGNYKNYIVNYILLNFNVRNVDCNVRIFKNQDPCIDDYNYLVYYSRDNKTPQSVIYKRNKYKTSHLYGKQTHNIIGGRSPSGKNFCNAVREFFDLNDGSNEYGVPLLKTSNGEQVKDENCGWYVANSTYQGIGEGKYLKIVLEDINNQPNTMNVLNRISASRGTGAKHLITDYNITQSINK